MLNYKYKIFLCILMLFSYNCTETSPSNSTTNSGNGSDQDNDDNAVHRRVYDMYYEWARKSRSHDYNGMINLCYPGGNFEGRTNVCKSQWDMNTEASYTFDTVEIVEVYKNPPKITVRGNQTFYQGPGNPSFYNGFYSNAMPLDGDFYSTTWRLNGINGNLDPFWWE